MYCLKSKALSKNQISQKGLITIPFLLVMIIVLFFFLSFLFLTMTLAHISITQYMSYSTARKLSLAGKDIDEQKTQAAAHYDTLRNQIFKSSAYTGNTGDWFVISSKTNPPELGRIGGYGDQPLNWKNMFYGAAVEFQSRIIKLHIPFLVKQDPDTEAVKAKVMSFLGREPSQEDCEKFNKLRGTKFPSEYSSLPFFDASIVNTEKGDNGC